MLPELINVIVCVSAAPINVIVCVTVATIAVFDDIWNDTRYHCVPSLAMLTIRVVVVPLGAGRVTSWLRTLTVFGVLVTP